MRWLAGTSMSAGDPNKQKMIVLLPSVQHTGTRFIQQIYNGEVPHGT
jgi:hypothetical protein